MVPASFRADWVGGEACNVLCAGISGRGTIQVMFRKEWFGEWEGSAEAKVTVLNRRSMARAPFGKLAFPAKASAGSACVVLYRINQ